MGMSARNPNTKDTEGTDAKEACGATKYSRLPFNLPSILAVKLLLPLCTSMLISSTLTNSDSPLVLICALTDGQIVLTNWSKFLPDMRGERYRNLADARYHERETYEQAQRSSCEEGKLEI